jgi:phasin family protein
LSDGAINQEETMPLATAQTELAVEVSPEPKTAPKPTAKAKVKAKKAVQTKTVKAKKSGDYKMPDKTSAYKKFEASFEPVMDFNKMIAGSMESSYNTMMDSFQGYAKLGLDSMQSGLKVRSPEDMVSFYETQQSMTQKATDMMMNDAKSYSDMGIKFFNEMRSMYESGVKTSVSAASEAMKA